jgi:16S rRNA (cytidine1402-2'-O)-methyltransferase
MPAVSDPGEDLVRLCAEANVVAEAVPGPCALICALAVSGLPTGRFTFEGFLATNRKNRRAHLEALKSETRPMLFYEAPHKLPSTLDDLADAFGPERRAAVCRSSPSSTRRRARTTLGDAAAFLPRKCPAREFVLVVAGRRKLRPRGPGQGDMDAALRRVAELTAGGESLGGAVRKAAKEMRRGAQRALRRGARR